MRKAREIAAFLLSLLLFLGLSWQIARLLLPERTAYGSMWEAYRQEEKNSTDLMVFGSSLAYCDVIPAYVWEESGLRSYVMAGPEQTLPISYYYIREACRTQSPRYIMLEVTEMFFEKYGYYTAANISYMPLSVNRAGAVFAGGEPELRFGLLFPLYSYHYRWTEAAPREIQSHLSPTADCLAGYTLLTENTPAPEEFDREFTAESETYEENLLWLEKIRDFCRKREIELLLYVTPAVGKIPTGTMETFRDDVAALGLTLTDFNENLSELEINGETDWYDPLHFNLRGAEKFSRWLGKYLAEECGFAPTETGDTGLWRERLQYVEDALAALVA